MSEKIGYPTNGNCYVNTLVHAIDITDENYVHTIAYLETSFGIRLYLKLSRLIPFYRR